MTMKLPGIRLVLFALLIVIVAGTGYAAATVSNARESLYRIYAKGFKIGEFRSAYSLVPHDNRKVLKFEAHTRIDANFVFYTYSLDSREEALVGEEGAVRYSRTSRENGVSQQIAGRLDNGRFLFDIREKGGNRSLAVPKEQYDATTMECPEISLKREGDEMTLRILDLEKLAVVKRHYRWVRSEEVTVEGKTALYRVIDFEDANKKGRRWIRKDGIGVIIARQDGKGKDGAYSLRMVKWIF